ncbi:MAG TPA: CYTH and CHAD domain-containing protein [Actinomycetota bacterium]
MREREVKLAAPPGFVPPAFDEPGMRAVPQQPREYDTVYVDTPDLRLARWRCSLRHRSGEGWTLKLPSEDEGDVLERDEILFEDDSVVPPARALDLVSAFVRQESLEPVVRLHTVRRPLQLMNDAGRPLGEIVLDDVAVEGAPGFREVEVEVQPEVSAATLDGLVQRLRAAGAGGADPMPKYLRALGPRAGRRPELDLTEPARHATVAEVVRFALSSSTERLLRHDPGVRLGTDPEAVHQARVATRRLRSDLKTFLSLLDADWAQGLRRDLRWVARQLGVARDADVLLDRLRGRLPDLREDDRARAIELLAELSWSGDRARQDLVTAMRGRPYLLLLDRLVEGSSAPPIAAAQSDRPAAEATQPLVSRQWRRLRASVEALGPEPADSELHEVRIETKRARYAAEAAGPALGKRVRRFAKRAATLQDVLGELQDSVVARRWLRKHGIEAGGSFAYVAGELSAAEERAGRQARAQWQRAWNRMAKAARKADL